MWRDELVQSCRDQPPPRLVVVRNVVLDVSSCLPFSVPGCAEAPGVIILPRLVALYKIPQFVVLSSTGSVDQRGGSDTVPRPVPAWKLGLKPDVDFDAVYEDFRVLLSEHLPMSIEKLASKLGRNRTTVSKWKSEKASDWKAGLSTQRKVIEVVQERVRAMNQQIIKVQQMLDALEGVGAAHKEHAEKLDHQSLDKLSAANDRVRDLLSPSGE